MYYRPSLNTLLQDMLSSNEIRLLGEVKVVRVVSSFKMENVIIFTVEAQIGKDPEIRFICYQTLREFFPRELLCFLEERGKIQL